MRKPKESKLDHVATQAKDGIEAVTDTAKDVVTRVVHGAKQVLSGARQRARDAQRAARDAALHTNDKLEDLKDQLN